MEHLPRHGRILSTTNDRCSNPAPRRNRRVERIHVHWRYPSSDWFRSFDGGATARSMHADNAEFFESASDHLSERAQRSPLRDEPDRVGHPVDGRDRSAPRRSLGCSSLARTNLIPTPASTPASVIANTNHPTQYRQRSVAHCYVSFLTSLLGRFARIA